MSKVLLLNNQYEPLNITSWKRAIVLLIKGKAECVRKINKVEDYIKIQNTYIPKTIKLTYNVAIPDLELPFSRENIYVRDNYTCQFCGEKFRYKDLTLDHVFPKSRGGKDTWENIVACCKKCNQLKADRTPEEAKMPLIKTPKRPDDYWLFELSKINREDEYIKEEYKKAS